MASVKPARTLSSVITTDSSSSSTPSGITSMSIVAEVDLPEDLAVSIDDHEAEELVGVGIRPGPYVE